MNRTIAMGPGSAGVAAAGSDRMNFPTDEVSSIIQKIVVNIVGRNTYHENIVSQWGEQIVNTCLDQLTDLRKRYKYAVSCMIFEKKNGGFHSSASCIWEPNTDGNCTVRWENKSLYCFVSVYGFYVPNVKY